MNTYPYIWKQSAWDLQERRGQRCRVIGSMVAPRVVVEFQQDGHQTVADPAIVTKAPRVKFTKPSGWKLRKELYEAADYRCACCGWQAVRPSRYDGRRAVGIWGRWLEIDHVVPHARGGTNARGNLQVLCTPCNAHKSAKL